MSVAMVTEDLGYSRHGVQPRGESMALGGQAATIREMLSRLDTLTMAGQRHSMSKIVAFVGSHVRRTLRQVGTRNGRTLVELIERLQGESERSLPDIAIFSRRAEDLLVLLSAVA
jgi:hypothetical protein